MTENLWFYDDRIERSIFTLWVDVASKRGQCSGEIQCILKTRGRETACLSTTDTGLSDYAPGKTLPMEVSFGLSKNANV